MADARIAGNGSCCPITAPEYAAGSRNKVYGWEITAVKEYPQAVALEELGMKRAPQSWQYVR